MHLLQLSTGQRHPDAPNPSVLTHCTGASNFSFTIQITQQHLGVLFTSHRREVDTQMLVWHWRTGQVELVSIQDRIYLALIHVPQSVAGKQLGSFSFLDDRCVLLGVVYDPDDEAQIQQTEPALLVVDFVSAQNDPTNILDLEYECALDFPLMLPWARALAISVRSDPSPSWSPNPDLKVPFYTARYDRLFVITFWVVDRDDMNILLLFVPSSTILSKLRSLPSDDRGKRFVWEQWGPDGTHLRIAPRGHSLVWVCYVFGMSFVAPYKPSLHVVQDDLGRPLFEMIQIFDFNQVAIKQIQAGGATHERQETAIITQPSLVTLSKIFFHRIETRLPYRLKTTHIPNQFNSAMLSEDAIVTVSDVSYENQLSCLQLANTWPFPARSCPEVPYPVFLTYFDVIEVNVPAAVCRHTLTGCVHLTNSFSSDRTSESKNITRSAGALQDLSHKNARHVC